MLIPAIPRALKEKNVRLVTVADGLFYCNTVRENVGVGGEREGERGERGGERGG